MMGGRTFWITGLSGAGKTTVANLLRERLLAAGDRPIILDGDRLRAVLGAEGRHDKEERRNLSFTYARLCRELAEQGFTVICATIAMFHDVRAWNRAHIPGYHEIYLRVPAEERLARDPKGLYRKAQEGAIAAMVGLGEPVDEPENPDLVIDNHGHMAPDTAVQQIWDRFIAV